MRKLIVECLGSFYLTLVAGLSFLMIRNAPYAPLSIGCTALIVTYIGFRISGGHFNPVITIASYAKGRVPLAQVPNYILAQFLGASIAFFPISFLTPNQSIPIGNTNSPQIFVAEFFFTLLLCAAYLLFSSSKKESDNPFLGLVIGAIYMVSLFLLGDISKGIINPILGFALLVFRTIPDVLIPVYVAAHILAALLAGLTVRFLEEK